MIVSFLPLSPSLPPNPLPLPLYPLASRQKKVLMIRSCFIAQAGLGLLGPNNSPVSLPEQLGLKLCTTIPSLRIKELFFFFLVALGFELRALHLLGTLQLDPPNQPK
jgi:hypothetical protein